jgi:hypothetical protein
MTTPLLKFKVELFQTVPLLAGIACSVLNQADGV